MCDKNTELKIPSSASLYLCCRFCVQTLQKGFQHFFLLDVTQQSWLLLTMILLGVLVYILSFTCFFVYWEVLATQPVPAVLKSQGSVQQLWAAGTTCSWASPFLGSASLCTPWAWWSKAEVAEADTSVIPGIAGLWELLGCGLAICALGRAEDQPCLRIFLFSQVYWHLWSNSLGTHCILLCWFFFSCQIVH